MRIKMIGIDFNSAGIKERELFAFTPFQLQQALKNIGEVKGIKGCVLISTCNRTELWVSEEKTFENDLIDLICSKKNAATSDCTRFFTSREGESAIVHLFETACGLRSQIIGEDQILAQIKSSIELAREVGTADELLEKLFQSAVTSSKKIKTDVHLTTADTSVAYAALLKAKEYFKDLSKVNCLMIGNGEMGRLAAELFVKNGANIFITLRNHKNGKNVIPEGCKPIDYDRRIEKIPQCDIIVSATISPHHTIKKEDLCFLPQLKKRLLFLDLALPRDIEETVADYENAILIDMDHIGMTLSVDEKALQKANRIIEEHKTDFYQWCILRKYLNHAKTSTYESLVTEIQKDIDGLNLNRTERSSFEYRILTILQKVI